MWASAIMDSGSTVDCFNDSSIFSDCSPSNRRLRVANNSVAQLTLRGLARLHTYDDQHNPICISIPDAGQAAVYGAAKPKKKQFL